jgi:UDP-glucose 4-epimerase
MPVKTYLLSNIEKVLVPGGAGFIGSHTVDLLLENNIAVRVLDNLSTGRRSNLQESNPLLEIIEGDIVDLVAVKKSLSGVSHCLHLAAQVSVVASLQDPVHSATQNIIGFVTVLNACQQQGIERLVYASSAAVYGDPDQIPLPEDSPRTPLSPYGLEKQVNEEYADLYLRVHGLSTLGQRFFNVYGPRQDPDSPYAGVITRFVDAISQNQEITVFGDGMQTRDFIYIKDVARANVAALLSDLTGVCNVGTNTSLNLLDLIDALSRITNKPLKALHLDTRDGDIRQSQAKVVRMNQQLGVRAQTDILEGLDELLKCPGKPG